MSTIFNKGFFFIIVNSDILYLDLNTIANQFFN